MAIRRDDEKKRPHYALASIQAQFVEGMVLVTESGRRTAVELDVDIVELVSGVKTTDFYKSVTDDYEHRVWEDVYHCEWRFLVLCVKFTEDPRGHFMLSLKAR